MRPEELEQTVAVWERARWQSLPWLEERMGYSHEQNLDFFRDRVAAENEVWLAVRDEVIVGLLAVQPGRLDRLYVEPSRQHQGIGTALLDQARSLLPGGFELYTHQRNRRARAFYERRGLRAVAFGVSPAPESEPDVRYAWVPEPRA